MRVRKRMIVWLVFAMITQLVSIPAFAETDTSNLAEVGYIGPGKYVADILVIEGGSPTGTDLSIGEMSLWNTRTRLWMNMEINPDWAIREVMIYVGEEDVPITLGGAPKLEDFPYQFELAEPVHTYEFSLDLLNDLDITWGKRDEARRLPKISVCLRVEPTADLSVQGISYAWVEGNREFLNHTGWWMEYAVTHPETGHFIDAPVKGVGYETPTHKGTTDSGGSFNYFDGESVEFYIGGVFIGKAVADHRVTPMDVIGVTGIDDLAVVRMAKLLQSFDEDGEPNGGIDISNATAYAFSQSAAELGIEMPDFSYSEEIDLLIEFTNQKLGGRLNLVSDTEALDNLDKGTTSNVVRKNVSKSAQYENAKAKLELMPVYVPAMKANGDPVTLNYYDPVVDNETGEETLVLAEQRNKAKPLISVYSEKVPGTNAEDVYAAISRDEGETWQVQNLSKSADKSSFVTIDGVKYPGTVKKPQVRVKNNYILVSWTSKFARTGNPRYALELGEPYYEDDIWGVGGPQRSRDYTDEGYPEVGELPYSAVWTCRGKIDKNSGEITWYKAERLTSGRRDAYQLMMNGVADAGFAIVWQEDPEGLRPGECAGPGNGWSGATTAHKTDIWYSYLEWEDFADIDEDFESNGVSKDRDENEDMRGRPKAEVPFSLPVRISDNDTLNLNSMKVDTNQISGLDSLAVGEVLDVDSSSFVPILDEEGSDGTHRYGYERMPSYYDGGEICDQIYHKINNQDADKYVAITEDGRMLDGNTGASRPNIMMQKFTSKNPDGSTRTGAWVVICYEETKGAGSGPDEETDVSVVSDETEGDPEGETAEPLDPAVEAGMDPFIADGKGVGDQKGKDAYTPDEGKLVIYHTFDMTKPDLVSGGEIMNPQVRIDSQADYDFYAWEDGSLPGLIPSQGNLDPKEGNVHRGLLFLVDGNGEFLRDWNGDLLPAYENARRPRLLIQGASGALGKPTPSSPAKWEQGTPLVMLFKMGEEGKGRPSDIIMRRWEITENFGKINKNPYDTVFLTDEILNVSSVTPTEFALNDRNTESRNGEGLKVLRWEQQESNLEDATFTNPYEDARAHRGILRGQQLAIAYDWTPNWAASRNGNDVYNVYLRRSFDGGKTFTTNPKGKNEIYIDGEYQGVGVLHTDTFRTELGTGNERIDDEEIPKEVVQTFYAKGQYEPARNLSQLQNNKISVIEPRLVGGPSSIKVNGEIAYGEDKRNINRFWLAFGTVTNPAKDSTEEKVALDIFYSYTDDFGDSFYEETKIVNPDSQGHYAGQERTVWPWLAKDTGNRVSEQAECQVRMSPDGTSFYAVWNEKSGNTGDVKFRRIMLNGRMMESDEDMIDLTPPFITINGIEDGDVRNEDVAITITLNELGSWEATLKEGSEETVYTENPIEIAASTSSKAYVLDVIATDLNNNTSYRTIAFTIDGNVPEIEILGVENGEHTNEDVHLTINTFDAEATIELLWNDSPMPPMNEYDLDAEGLYELTVTAELEGHTAQKHISFVIDRTPPEIRVDGVDESVVYKNSADPTVVVTDNFSHHLQELTILLNGEEYLSSTKINEEGEYELYVKATDLAGNTTELTVNFAIEIDGTRYHHRIVDSGIVAGIIEAGVETTILFKDDFATLHVPANEFDEKVTYRIVPISGANFTGSGLKIGNQVYEIQFFDEEGDLIETLNLPMTLTFAYSEEDLPVSAVETEIQVCYWDETLNEWIVVPSAIDVEGNLIVADISHLSIFGVRSVKDFPSLNDCKNHWAMKHIYRLASLGIASGDQNGNYHPDDPITREELAKILVNAVGLESTSQVALSDADEVSKWAKEYMRIALTTGAIELNENQMARPKEYATRGDLIVAANAVFGLKDLGSGDMQFIDLGLLEPKLQETVRLLAQHGIMQGYGNGTIKPNNRILRGELAKMIAVFLKNGGR